MREFYANIRIVKVSNLVVRIRGKKVYFRAEQINKVYRLQEVDMTNYEAKYCDFGS